MRTRATALALTFFVALPSGTAQAQTVAQCVHSAEEGQDLRAHGKLRAARASFVACGREACALVLRKDCAHWLEEVDADLPTVVFGAKDAERRDVSDVTVRIDGGTESNAASGLAVGLDPGPHELRFERPRSAPVVERIVLRMGERNRSVVAVFSGSEHSSESSSSPAPGATDTPATHAKLSPFVYVLGGLGLAAAGSSAYFGLTGLEKKSELRASCGPACTDAEVSGLRTRYIVADVSLVVGVLALAAAGWLAFAPPSATKAQAVRFELTPTATQLRF